MKIWCNWSSSDNDIVKPFRIPNPSWIEVLALVLRIPVVLQFSWSYLDTFVALAFWHTYEWEWHTFSWKTDTPTHIVTRHLFVCNVPFVLQNWRWFDLFSVFGLYKNNQLKAITNIYDCNIVWVHLDYHHHGFPCLMQKSQEGGLSFCSEVKCSSKEYNHTPSLILNSYSASHDNWCTETPWNRIITAQSEGMGK